MPCRMQLIGMLTPVPGCFIRNSFPLDLDWKVAFPPSNACIQLDNTVPFAAKNFDVKPEIYNGNCLYLLIEVLFEKKPLATTDKF